jgi:hypothetical protein
MVLYYSNDRQVIIDFCRTYGINYLVVDLEAYSGEYLARGQIFYEPFNQKLLPRIAGQDTFVLAQVPDNYKLFQAESYFVVACNDI